MPLIISGTQGISRMGTTWTYPDDLGRMLNPNQPSFATHGTSSNWAVSNTGDTYVPYDATPTWNQGGHYNSGTYKFTAPLSGVYFVSFSALIYPNSIPSTYFITLYASINNSGYSTSVPMARHSFKESQTTMGNSGLVKLTAGDNVGIKAGAYGTGLTLYVSSGHAQFSMYFLG